MRTLREVTHLRIGLSTIFYKRDRELRLRSLGLGKSSASVLGRSPLYKCEPTMVEAPIPIRTSNMVFNFFTCSPGSIYEISNTTATLRPS